MSRILVIDDVPALRQMISECLTFEHDVAVAPNGKTGIEIAKAYRPDLVICDLIMPEMDGFTVLKYFKNMPETVGVPFVFLSASTDYTVIHEGMTLGAVDFLTKPFSVPKLLEIVRYRLENKNFSINPNCGSTC